MKCSVPEHAFADARGWATDPKTGVVFVLCFACKIHAEAAGVKVHHFEERV